MNLNMDAARVAGLPRAEQDILRKLLKIYAKHESKNNVKARYYEGDITLAEVNLGLALPEGIARPRLTSASVMSPS